jgi:hypothetical protein
VVLTAPKAVDREVLLVVLQYSKLKIVVAALQILYLTLPLVMKASIDLPPVFQLHAPQLFAFWKFSKKRKI